MATKRTQATRAASEFSGRRTLSKAQFEQLRTLLANQAYTLRRETIDALLNTTRDVDEECQYPATIAVSDYQAMYERMGLAARIVSLWPDECWKQPPEVYETEESDTTPFEEAWRRLCESVPVWDAMHRADILSGIGRYGVLLLGLDDGKELSEPADGLDERGERTAAGERSLLYLKPVSENSATIETPKQTDKTNPRYGLPLYYRITFENEAGSETTTEVKVHWTRCIHLADNRADSDVYGVPRLRDVYNDLLDLKKVSGGASEMFWKGGFPGYSFELTPEAQKAGTEGLTVDLDSIKEQMLLYSEGLQRWMYLTGITMKDHAPQIADPSGNLEWKVKLIAMAKGVPYRLLLGTEEARLAGAQDKRAWNERVQRRRNGYLTAMVVRPCIDRLIALGVLPEPERYTVAWPDIEATTEAEVASVAKDMTEAMAKYVVGGVDALVPPRQYLTTVLKMTDEQADAILAAAEQAEAEMDAEED